MLLWLLHFIQEIILQQEQEQRFCWVLIGSSIYVRVSVCVGAARLVELRQIPKRHRGWSSLRWFGLRKKNTQTMNPGSCSRTWSDRNLWSQVFYLWLVRLPANHVEDLKGGGDGPVLVTVHLWNVSTQTETELKGQFNMFNLVNRDQIQDPQKPSAKWD